MLPSGQQIRYARFKYIHIWASDQALKVKATDPTILVKFIRAIQKTYPQAEFERHSDINDQFHAFRLRDLNVDSAQGGDSDGGGGKNVYLGLAWWMFRVLCDRGWEPMETGSQWYKLKYQEVVSEEG
jgi:hypothetical protein